MLTAIVLIVIIAIAVAAGVTYYYLNLPSTTTTPTSPVVFTHISTEEYSSLDPQFATGAGEDFSIMINVYDRLFSPAIVNGVETFVPDLVTNYNVSSDGLTWTMQIHQGVKFHDGTEMTAEDVVWSFNRYLEYGHGFSYLYTGLIGPGNTTALDNYTVQFTFSQPYTSFAASLVRFAVLNSKLVTAHILEGTLGHDWLNFNDAGSGPYYIKEVHPHQDLVLAMYVPYWKGWASGRRITEAHFIPVIETSTMKQELISGTADIDDGWMSADDYRSLATYSSLVIERFPWVQERVLSMNNQKFPFDDIHVRKAVSWVFNYTDYNQVEEWNAPQAQGPVPVGLFGHESSLFVYHQNLTAAIAELAQSKYTPAQLAQPIIVPVYNDKTEEVALYVADQLKAINLTIQPMMTTYSQILASFALGPQSAPSMVWWGNTEKYPSPDAYLYSVFSNSSWGTWQGQCWYNNSEVQTLLVQSLHTVDQTQLLQLYSSIQQKIVDDAPMIWLANPKCDIVVQKWVHGFTWVSALGEYLYLPNFTIDQH